MRETTNLKLTQFDGSDVPNWLDQYNSDNLKIDTAIGEQAVKNTEFSNTNGNLQTQISNNRNQIDENTQDIANTKKDVVNIKGGSDSSIGALEKKLTTTDQTVDTLKTTVGSNVFSNVGASITEAIGNTAIVNNKSISDDLAELHTELTTTNSDLVRIKDDIAKLEQSAITIFANATFGMVNTVSGVKQVQLNISFEKSLEEYGISNGMYCIINPSLVLGTEGSDKSNLVVCSKPQTVTNVDIGFLQIPVIAVVGTLDTTTDYSFYHECPVTFYK